jgi:hypothetical protein
VVKPIEPGPAVPDWLSYNYDRERSEVGLGRQLSKQTVGSSSRYGTTGLPNAARPVLHRDGAGGGEGVPQPGGDLVLPWHEDTLTALDAGTGDTVWQKHFANH